MNFATENYRLIKEIGVIGAVAIGNGIAHVCALNGYKVTIQDAVEANRVFSKLMGEEVSGRREFIEKNAKFVVNLDV